MSEDRLSTQLAVVGAGPGGYAAAFLAADLGMEVTLIDPESQPGGVCLHRGCIPSKALLHVAKVVEEAQRAAQWGVDFGKPRFDLPRLRDWKAGVVGKLTRGLGELAKKRRVSQIRGRAHLLDGSRLEIVSGEGAARRLSFEHAILATGSRPAGLPDLDPDGSRIVDSTGALELADVPRRLLVVGGGYIGLEMGSVYAALGSQVTLVEITPHLLPGVDGDLVRPLSRRLERAFEAIYLSTRVARVEPHARNLKVFFEGEDRDRKEHLFDKILVSVGRHPNSDDLGLEKAGVEVDRHGFVRVDGSLRTSHPHVWAIGDLVGAPMLAHKATHEGRTAVEALMGGKAVFEPAAIPAVVFTEPEIAWCGLTETEARKQERSVEIVRYPWAASGRAQSLDHPEGLTKLLIDPKSQRVLGMGITGTGAGELIAEGVLAIEMAAVVDDLRMSIHPHPTLSETIMESADLFFGQSTHFHRPPVRESAPVGGIPRRGR